MNHFQSTLKVLLLSFLVVCMTLSSVSADVLTPGESPVSYCFQVANINKYPDYLLVTQVKSQNSNIRSYNRILRQDKCLGLNGYREYGEVFAIQKNQIKPQEIVTTKEGEEIKNFNTKQSVLIPAKSTINSVRTFDDRYKINKIADVLEITAIKSKLDLKYKQVIYTFKNGKIETKNYQVQNNRPTPGAKSSKLLNFILPGLSIAGILLVWKKSRS